MLVFAPSYSLLDRAVARWQQSGAWARIAAVKAPLLEPRQGSKEDFEATLTAYYQVFTVACFL